MCIRDRVRQRFPGHRYVRQWRGSGRASASSARMSAGLLLYGSFLVSEPSLAIYLYGVRGCGPVGHPLRTYYSGLEPHARAEIG
eukprot:9452297-Pyramimonas_sp.AAC.1